MFHPWCIQPRVSFPSVDFELLQTHRHTHIILGGISARFSHSGSHSICQNASSHSLTASHPVGEARVIRQLQLSHSPSKAPSALSEWQKNARYFLKNLWKRIPLVRPWVILGGPMLPSHAILLKQPFSTSQPLSHSFHIHPACPETQRLQSTVEAVLSS